jgi:hypothetical protein
MIPDQGTLKETAPAKLLLALYEQSQTGILYFRQNEILKVFYLNRGKISWAISSDEEDRIERILLAKNLVNPDMLAPYQGSNKISESFGKVLVENGVLSLEGLINATREQVHHIANSVMRWSNGNYQLAQEPPPTRLVSLDLEIPGLVANYILTQMDVNIVWEELGSLSGELQQNLEPGKQNLYSLDVEQKEVFSHFERPQRLESVLLEFPAERKYRILRILYYFLLTGLLRKKEAEKTPSLDFKELDSLFGQAPPNAPAEVDIEMPAMIDEAAIKDIPLAELPEISVAKEESAPRELPDLPDLMPPEPEIGKEEIKEIVVEREAERAQPKAHPFRVPEKQKPRWLSISFLSVLLAAILIGAFLWFTRSPKEPEKAAEPPVSRAKAQGHARVGTVPEEQKTVPRPDSETAAVGTEQAQAGAAPMTEKAAGEEKKSTATKSPPAGATESPGEKARPIQGEVPLTTAVPSTSARQDFAAGNFRAAGDAWRGEIIATQTKFSILLEMDCLKESVRIAYRQVEDKGNFFLLNKTSRDGRSCWLVLWGRYRTADEAALGLKLLPPYFWKQSEPPSVIELEPYL